jgi:hypothetical protein
LPNAPGNPVTGLNNYVASGVQTTDRNALGLRTDHYITPQQQVGVRYTNDRSTLISPLYFGGNNIADPGSGPTEYTRNGVAVLYTNAVTSNFLVELRTGFNRFGINRDPISLGFDTTKLGFPSTLNQQLQLQEFPRFAFSTTSAIGSNQSDPATQRNNAYSWGGSTTWVRGTHTLKAGAEGRIYQWNALQGTGVLQFNFDANFTKGPSPNAAATNGYDFASFLLGTPASGTLTRHQNFAYTTKYGAFFVQDDWKITSRLVANYELRYEHEGLRPIGTMGSAIST